jgi:hypothetical protein
VAVSETYAGECASLNIKAVHKDDYVHKFIIYDFKGMI